MALAEVNGAAGRDHWNFCYSLLLAGGGIKAGHVHGASDRIGARPSRDPVSPADVVATIYHCLGIPAHLELRDRLNRPFQLVPWGSPSLSCSPEEEPRSAPEGMVMDEQRNSTPAVRNSPFMLGTVLGALLGLYAGGFLCSRYGSAEEAAEEAASLYREKVQRDLGALGIRIGKPMKLSERKKRSSPAPKRCCNSFGTSRMMEASPVGEAVANKGWAWFLLGELSGVLFGSALAAAICWANCASTCAARLEQARISAGELLSNIEAHRSAKREARRTSQVAG